eukprot:7118279-Pyramimonas_sp.AAC.1
MSARICIMLASFGACIPSPSRRMPGNAIFSLWFGAVVGESGAPRRRASAALSPVGAVVLRIPLGTRSRCS